MRTTWKPRRTSGELDTKKRNDLPKSAFAFPDKRKEQLTDASHARYAIARFDQVQEVGEAASSSELPRKDISSGRRGGLRSHRGSGGRTPHPLCQEAMRRNIKGRSSMTKAELERAVGRKQ